jgi:hypothetical protein
MRRTLFILLLSTVAIVDCFAEKSRSGPLPYLLFNFNMTNLTEARMLSANSTQFRYTARPRNFWLGRDTVTVEAKLLKKTSKGFRFSLSVAHSAHGQMTRTFLVPWSEDPKTVYAVRDFEATCFYSAEPVQPVTVIAQNRPNQAL